MVLEEKKGGMGLVKVLLWIVACGTPTCTYLFILWTINPEVFWKNLTLPELGPFFVLLVFAQICLMVAVVLLLMSKNKDGIIWSVVGSVKAWRILRILLGVAASIIPMCVLIWMMRDLWVLYPGEEFWENLPKFYSLIAFLGIFQVSVLFFLIIWKESEKIDLGSDSDSELEA